MHLLERSDEARVGSVWSANEYDQRARPSGLKKICSRTGLKAGDVGTVVLVHRKGEAFEVEFLTLNGETVGVATLTAAQVRPVLKREITHAG